MRVSETGLRGSGRLVLRGLEGGGVVLDIGIEGVDFGTLNDGQLPATLNDTDADIPNGALVDVVLRPAGGGAALASAQLTWPSPLVMALPRTIALQNAVLDVTPVGGTVFSSASFPVKTTRPVLTAPVGTGSVGTISPQVTCDEAFATAGAVVFAVVSATALTGQEIIDHPSAVTAPAVAGQVTLPDISGLAPGDHTVRFSCVDAYDNIADPVSVVATATAGSLTRIPVTPPLLNQRLYSGAGHLDVTIDLTDADEGDLIVLGCASYDHASPYFTLDPTGTANAFAERVNLTHTGNYNRACLYTLVVPAAHANQASVPLRLGGALNNRLWVGLEIVQGNVGGFEADTASAANDTGSPIATTLNTTAGDIVYSIIALSSASAYTKPTGYVTRFEEDFSGYDMMMMVDDAVPSGARVSSFDFTDGFNAAEASVRIIAS